MDWNDGKQYGYEFIISNTKFYNIINFILKDKIQLTKVCNTNFIYKNCNLNWTLTDVVENSSKKTSHAMRYLRTVLYSVNGSTNLRFVHRTALRP